LSGAQTATVDSLYAIDFIAKGTEKGFGLCFDERSFRTGTG